MKLINLLAIVVTLNCSAYCHTGNPTASGVWPAVGMCAMDKVNGVTVPFGSKVYLPDGRVLTVTDRFGGGYDNRLDNLHEHRGRVLAIRQTMVEMQGGDTTVIICER